jgi:hypothetical protein
MVADGSDATTVTVTARDAQGDPVPGAAVVLSVSGSENTITQPAVTDASGAATGSFTTTSAGTKTVSASAGGVSVTQTQDVTADPPPAFSLSVQLSGNQQGTISGDVLPYIDCNQVLIPLEGTLETQGVCDVDYPVGTEITLSTTAGFFETNGWSAPECQAQQPAAPCTFVMSEDRVVSTSIEWDAPPPTLTIEGWYDYFAGSGAVTSQIGLVNPVACQIDLGQAQGSCSFLDYPPGTVVILTATPDGGSQFVGWVDQNGNDYPGCAGVGTCSVTMQQQQDRAIYAWFEPPTANLTVQLSGTKPGNISGDALPYIDCNQVLIPLEGTLETQGVCDVDYPIGTEITLTTTGDLYSWNGWDQPECQAQNPAGPCTFVMSGDRVESGNIFWDNAPPLLTIDAYEYADGTGTVTSQGQLVNPVSCQVTLGTAAAACLQGWYYPDGTVVILTANAALDFVFYGWVDQFGSPYPYCDEGAGGSGDTCTLTMENGQDYLVYADFVSNE